MLNRVRAYRHIVVNGRSVAPRRVGGPGSFSGWGGLQAKLARGGLAALAVHVAGAGLTYFAQFAVARTIGAHGYGIYAYVLAWVTILAYVSALGFDVSLLRFVPAYRARQAFAPLRGVIRYAWQRAGLLGCGITLSGVVLVLFRFSWPSSELADTFIVGFAMVPVLALLWVGAAVVRGFGGVISALAPDRTVREGVLLGLVLLASAGVGWRIDATWAMAATLLGSITGLSLVILAVRRLTPDAVRAVAPVYEAPAWCRAALPMLFIGLSEALMNRTGVMLLGWLVDTRQAGIYALTFNIAFAVTLPRTAMNALLVPAMSDLFARDDRAALRATVAKAGLYTFLGAFCVGLPLFVFAKPVLALFGQDFIGGVPTLRILLIGQMICALAGSQLQLMMMTGRELGAAVNLVSSAVANAGMGAVLIRLFGPAGAAIAATTALIGWNAAMGMSIRRHLHFFPGVFADWPDDRRHRAGREAAGP